MESNTDEHVNPHDQAFTPRERMLIDLTTVIVTTIMRADPPSLDKYVLPMPADFPTKASAYKELSRGSSKLTPREIEVLYLIVNGQSNKEAGKQLGISPRTIEVHRARVMEKLHVVNTAQLVLRAKELGMV